jgi:hypothetical protein
MSREEHGLVKQSWKREFVLREYNLQYKSPDTHYPSPSLPPETICAVQKSIKLTSHDKRDHKVPDQKCDSQPNPSETSSLSDGIPQSIFRHQ